MANITIGRYVRDIKISALVAVVFMVILFGLFLANNRFRFSERLVNLFVTRFYSGI